MNRINSLFGILFTYHLVSTINFVIFCSKNFWEFVVILRHNVINKYILFYTTSWWLFFPVIGGDLRKMIRLLPTAMVCNLLYLRQLIVWFLHEEIISTLNFTTRKYQTYNIFFSRRVILFVFFWLNFKQYQQFLENIAFVK